MFQESMSKFITVTLTETFNLNITKPAVFSTKGVLDGICLPTLMAAKWDGSNIWESSSEESVREWLWESTIGLGKALWTVTVGNNPALARRSLTWSNMTFPSVMSLIYIWRNNKCTFDVQLLCSRLTSVCIVAWHLPGSCFQSPFWGLEMRKSTYSSIVPIEIGHIWDTHEDPLSWKCSWGFYRPVQEVCALQWSHALLSRVWLYRIRLSKDNLIHTHFIQKSKRKNTHQYTSYFRKLFAKIPL